MPMKRPRGARSVVRYSLALLVFLAGVCSPLQAEDPKPQPSNKALKGITTKVGDYLVVYTIKVPVADFVQPLCWADAKGTAFFCLERQGLLRRITVPDLKEVQKLDL